LPQGGDAEMLTLDQVLADHDTVDYLDLDIQVIEKLLLILADLYP
jgi:hypothetical protein